MNNTILLITHNRNGFLKKYLEFNGYKVVVEGYDFLLHQNGNYYAVILDLKYPDESVIKKFFLFKSEKKIILTSFLKEFFKKKNDMVILKKPIYPKLLLQTLEKNIKIKREEKNFLNIDGYIIYSKKMREVYEITKKVANTTATVLINGETGVGKEVFATFLHNLSDRKDKPFIKVNCAAMPENLLESELFGYEKGAFTGANSTKIGKFEAANGGTLFLDEIGELPLQLQAKLLRVLQEKTVERLGSTKTRFVDVRIIAATNRNLKEMTDNGDFRGDLYYRLNVIKLNIPPLRERREDIPVLVDYFIQKFNYEYKKEIKGVSDEVSTLFQKYKWPGNVRELRNLMEATVILSTHTIITKELLPEDFLKEVLKKSDFEEKSALIALPRLEEKEKFSPIELEEKKIIEEFLAKNGGNKSKTAKMLGITRKTLYTKLRKYGIE